MGFWDSIKKMPLEEFELKLKMFDEDFPNLTDKELENLFNELGIGSLTHEFILAPNICLFRGIKYDNKPNLITELSYPPASLTRQNRANKKGDSIFYCSSTKDSVFYELDLKSGDRVAISTWVVHNEILINNLSLMDSNISRYGLAKPLTNEIIDEMKEETKYQYLPANYLIDYVTKTFCKKIDKSQEIEYRKTQAIAKLYFNNPFQGLIYPTIKFDGLSDNFAIKPFVLDTNQIQFTSVEYVEIVSCSSNDYIYKILDYCDALDDQKLIWYEFSNSWTNNTNSQTEIAFIKEGIEISAYDQNGELILPD